MKKRTNFFLLKEHRFLKHLLLLCFLFVGVANAFSQAKSVTGTVTDSFKEPLIGVSVVIRGTTTGTVTDIDGQYSISAAQGDQLVFSFVGMKSQTVTIGAGSQIDIVLQDDATMLTETVVIGYGSAKKRDLTGSIVSIKASDFADRPAANALASIQGRVAGVQITNTGRVGQDPEIRIRGTNSINNFKPLYVVDGLFTDNINYLNPTDIESMEILKDASSLAIFGVRGANGVIIISTKRAKEGQTVVNINSTVGFSTVVDRVKLTDATQFRELYDEQRKNQGAASYNYNNWQANTDWQNEIYQKGLITNNNVSITGSNEKNRFYLGAGYISEEGTIKHEKFSRVTVNLSSDYNVSKALRFGFQVNGSRSLPPDAKNPYDALRAAPIAPVTGSFVDKLGFTNTYFHTMPDFQRTQVYNPMLDIELKKQSAKATNYRGAGNVYGELDFLKHFTLKTIFSLDFQSNDLRSFSPLFPVYNPEIGGERPVEQLRERASVSQTKENHLTAQADYMLTYVNKFGDHGLTATAGITTNYMEFSKLNGSRDEASPIPYNPNAWYLTIGDKNTAKNDGEQWEKFTQSYLLRALYNYQNKYLFNTSFRRDGSSAFFKTNNTWQNFYSFGGAWVASEEKFMADQDVVNFLKIKGSWGILGNQNIGGSPYPAYPDFTSEGGLATGPNNTVLNPGYGPSYIPDANLRWEKVVSWEAGFEVELLNSRLRLEPLYYSKITKDVLLSLPGISGSLPGLTNAGEIENKGVELTATWSDKINADWKYTVGANFTSLNNNVKSLASQDFAIYAGDKKNSRTVVGYPVAYFFGYKVAGVYQNDDDIANSPVSTFPVQPGDLKFQDVTGDGRITEADRTMIGNPTPDFTYGLNFNISYKNFDFGMDMMGVYGNEIYRIWDNNTFAQFNYLSARQGRWNGEGTSNWEPILDPSRANNYQNSDYFIEDGSFFRIRNIQLGYTFDSAVLKKVYLRSARIFVNAQNPKTWKKNTGYTPEIGGDGTAFGIDNGTYPMPAIYTFGVNLTF